MKAFVYKFINKIPTKYSCVSQPRSEYIGYFNGYSKITYILNKSIKEQIVVNLVRVNSKKENYLRISFNKSKQWEYMTIRGSEVYFKARPIVLTKTINWTKGPNKLIELRYPTKIVTTGQFKKCMCLPRQRDVVYRYSKEDLKILIKEQENELKSEYQFDILWATHWRINNN